MPPEPEPASEPAVGPPPNLLLILLDDWGIDRFDGFPTQPDTPARTPRLDALAAEGLLFTRAYADPACSPSRAALLTGRYGLCTGVTNVFGFYREDPHDFELDPARERPLASELGKLGYATFAVGKWHLTGPESVGDGYTHALAMGFDVHRGVMANLTFRHDYDYRDYELNFADATGAVQQQVRDGTYLTTRQVDDALELIAAADPARPWFTYLALSAPHQPWTSPPRELVSVDVDDLEGPAAYEAVLEAADTEIGRLLDSLDPAVRARTLVIVAGDNGTPGDAFADPAARRSKKGFPTDAGTHVPLIVAGPGVPRGTDDRLVHLVDLHATLLELAGGAGVTAHSQGFAPALRGEPCPERAWVYSLIARPIGFPPNGPRVARHMLRDDAWRLERVVFRGEAPRDTLWFLGDRLWGEGREVTVHSPASLEARERLLAALEGIDCP